MTKVTVYKVQLYDSAKDAPFTSSRMATREGAAIMNGTVIEGTGYVIDLTELENGNQWTPRGFDPVAVGGEKQRY